MGVISNTAFWRIGFIGIVTSQRLQHLLPRKIFRLVSLVSTPKSICSQPHLSHQNPKGRGKQPKENDKSGAKSEGKTEGFLGSILTSS
jgi:hypothetical protein